jgi:integrase
LPRLGSGVRIPSPAPKYLRQANSLQPAFLTKQHPEMQAVTTLSQRGKSHAHNTQERSEMAGANSPEGSQSGFSRSFASRRDAEIWAREMERRADLRELPNNVRLLDHYTLGDLVRRYKETITKHKRGAGYERIILDAFLRHPLCSKRVSAISGSDFAAYRNERLQRIRPSSLKRQLSPLQNLFEVAKDEWGVPIRENPLTKLRLTSCQQRRERRLREGELEKLTLSAQHYRNRLVLPIILFALETGMRRGEILSLMWVDVHWIGRSVLLPQSKNGHSRAVPLSTTALAILKSLPKTSERTFPMSATAFRLAWDRVRSRAGLSDLHFHDLRHEAISRFFELGLSVPEVALISGHRDMRMLFRYTHAARETILKKLN